MKNLAYLLLLTCSYSYAENQSWWRQLVDIFQQPVSCELPDNSQQNIWYQQGQQQLQQLLNPTQYPKQAKNVIFFIGDGMSVATVTAARILQGQQQGNSGEENLLSFEKFPQTALSKTYNTNQQTPDSAGTMTAMITGIKTKAGVLSVDETVQRGVCGNKQSHITSLLTEAEQAGLKTGVVTTARLTHATPAATYAHSENRDWEADADIPQQYRSQCQDIARQFVDYDIGDGIEVAMGGGRRNFIGSDSQDLEYPNKTGKRLDGKDLTKEWLAKHQNSAYVWNQKMLKQLDLSQIDHLLGLFEPSHMQYEIDRANDGAGEPSLSEMTKAALNILQRDQQPFLLVVEAGRIDHGHHAGSAKLALTETVELSDAVDTALSMVDLNDTLIMVTADHAHSFSISGYAKRGNPILGKIAINDRYGNPAEILQKDAQGKPMTTLSYANGPGYINGDQRPDLTHVDTEAKDYKQAATVPLKSETHSGEDVIIYATGAGSQPVTGVLEQNLIYHIMKHALSKQLNHSSE